jgi:predicted protein tyrosine phosphatase
MKILCICERGNSRSVVLAYMFKDIYGQDALAIGIRTASEETKTMLYSWADVIILVDKMFENEIPMEYGNKLKIWDVGPDRYFQGFHPELLGQYEEHIKNHTTIVKHD